MFYNFFSAFDFSYIFGNFSDRWYYYAGLLAAFIILFLFFVLRKAPTRNSLSATQKITYTAVLTALSAIANIFTFFIVPNRYAVSFVAIPCFIAGYLLGAKEGFIVGFLGDLIGCIIMPAGTYLPIIGFASGLWGFIPGVVFEYAKWKRAVKLTLSFVFCFIICSAFLTTLGNWLFIMIDLNSSTTFFVYLSVRVWFQAIIAVVNAVLCFIIMLLFDRILRKDRFSLN